MGLFSNKEQKQAKAAEKHKKKSEQVENLFAGSLFEDEKIIDFLIGNSDNALWKNYLVLTNKRLIFKEGLTEKTAEIKNITSVEQKLIALEVKGSAIDIQLKCVTFGDIPAMVHNINKAKDQLSSTKSIVQETDNLDQIKKLKSLLDDGIITQDEFDTKKKQLLEL